MTIKDRTFCYVISQYQYKVINKINSYDERTSTSADIRFKHFLVIVFDCLPVLKDFLFPESKSCLRFVTNTQNLIRGRVAGGSSMRKSSFWKKYQIRGGFAGVLWDFALSRRFWKNRQYDASEYNWLLGWFLEQK